jgi:glutamate N-acetyltransferase/amino-acid N-acetyltransferase
MAGVRYGGRTDVMLALLDPGTAVAGTFTRSRTRSAPVRDCEEKLAASLGDRDAPAAFLVNSGNSNAFTGRAGEAAVDAIARAASRETGVPAARVFTASTGVIGEPLPWERIAGALPALRENLGASWEEAARAIMTTDTFPRARARPSTCPAGRCGSRASPRARA